MHFLTTTNHGVVRIQEEWMEDCGWVKSVTIRSGRMRISNIGCGWRHENCMVRLTRGSRDTPMKREKKERKKYNTNTKRSRRGNGAEIVETMSKAVIVIVIL